MDALTTRMVKKATKLFIDDFKDIESRVPDCFRSNPGGRITPTRRKELMQIAEKIERYNATRA